MDDAPEIAGAKDGPVWTPPTLEMAYRPSLMSTCRPRGATVQGTLTNFYRVAKWCPDGSCALSLLEDRRLEIILSSDTDDFSLRSSFLSSPQASAVLDVQWYPAASVLNPGYFCYVVSVRDSPIKLLNASDGVLRASYSIVDHRERFIAPHCLVFDPTATRLYCGFENAIEVFDFNTPGADAIRLPTTVSKRTKGGLKGIISSLSFSPDYSSGIYAAGSFGGSAALFTTQGGTEMIGKLRGVRGAVSQVQFHTTRPEIVFVSSRRSDVIQSWDIRNPRYVLQEYTRKGRQTNQRMKFDIDYGGKWLAAGGEDGTVSIFDISNDANTEPALSWPAHQDAVGSVAFNPTRPHLLSVSGSRHFGSADLSEESDQSESESDSEEELSSPGINDDSQRPTFITRRRLPELPIVRDPNMRMWSFEKHCEGKTPDDRE